jgi:hypothetical protein
MCVTCTERALSRGLQLGRLAVVLGLKVAGLTDMVSQRLRQLLMVLEADSCVEGAD